jgi:hypothetical protein
MVNATNLKIEESGVGKGVIGIVSVIHAKIFDSDERRNPN